MVLFPLSAQTKYVACESWVQRAFEVNRPDADMFRIPEHRSREDLVTPMLPAPSRRSRGGTTKAELRRPGPESPDFQ